MPSLNDSEILHRFLGWRARRFVERVRAEWRMYNSPYTKARTGCLHRDAVRVRLERLAYYRYTKSNLCPCSPST